MRRGWSGRRRWQAIAAWAALRPITALVLAAATAAPTIGWAAPLDDPGASGPLPRLAAPVPQDDAARVLDWVESTRDSQGLPFVIIDKRNSEVRVYDAAGALRGASPALVGVARGDVTEPGIGERPIASIRPEERVTPSGRFRAVMGRGPKGEDILWVDYNQALALHRVVTNVPAERRLERLRSPRPEDRRITYGCINVPVRFFEDVVRPVFSPAGGMVYILPETTPLASLIGTGVATADAGQQGQPVPNAALLAHVGDSVPASN